MQGSILNEIYQIQSQLSQRGGRETLLAKNLDTNELVVIKLLKFGLDAPWSEFKLFEREAKTLQNINHPAIPNYLDYFELDLPHCKGFALVQEYIAAPSLEVALKAGRTFIESEITEIAIALLNILQYLHQQQPSIIHRDLKPSNILLGDRTGNSVGRVYLIDFGAVKNVAATDGGTITVVGTYGYMPPEQFGGKTTPASDLYSLGATLIHLATGKHPAELPSKAGKIVFEPSVQLNYALIRWLNQLIEPSCDRRFDSATRALQTLQQPQITNLEAVIVKQPAFSKIVLHRTVDEINVIIPGAGFRWESLGLIFFALFWNLFLVVWTGGALFIPLPFNLVFLIFSIPFWACGLGLIGKIIFDCKGYTRLSINFQEISLTYECLKFRYQKQQSTSRKNLTAIECVQSGWNMVTDRETTPVISEVVLWADGKPFKITSSVGTASASAKATYSYDPATIELRWLAQELSQWLNLPLTRTESSATK
ncbi:MAG: serine/threonine-protein kinase [Cyanobacteria bacterium P01_E01_bin.35]